MKKINIKKLIILNIPYVIVGLVATNIGEAFRIAGGTNASEKLQSVILVFKGFQPFHFRLQLFHLVRGIRLCRLSSFQLQFQLLDIVHSIPQIITASVRSTFLLVYRRFRILRQDQVQYRYIL